MCFLFCCRFGSRIVVQNGVNASVTQWTLWMLQLNSRPVLGRNSMAWCPLLAIQTVCIHHTATTTGRLRYPVLLVQNLSGRWFHPTIIKAQWIASTLLPQWRLCRERPTPCCPAPWEQGYRPHQDPSLLSSVPIPRQQTPTRCTIIGRRLNLAQRPVSLRSVWRPNNTLDS